MSLQIKCPKCSRRFEVDEKLEGKTVECGNCDTQFNIEEDIIVHERVRMYPGEQKSPLLDRIAHAPMRKTTPVKFQTASYAQNVNTDALTPVSASQKAAVAGGFGVLVITAFFFYFASNWGGALQDVDQIKRIILGSFFGLLGGGLIIFGAKNWRFMGGVMALAFFSGILALIFFRPVHLTPSGSGPIDDPVALKDDSNAVLSESEKEELFKKRIGYNQVQRQIDESGDEEEVVGIYVHPFEEHFKPVLVNYLTRKLQLKKSQIPGTYTRDDDRALLLVFSGVTLSFDELIGHAEVLGAVRPNRDLRLIDVTLSMRHFENPEGEIHQMMTDPTHPNYSEANLAELRHIDFLRAKKAVERIDTIPPSVQLSSKPEVVKELLRLLTENDDLELNENIGTALITWAGKDQKIAEKVGDILMTRLDTSMPPSLVNYLLEAGASQAPVIVDTMWAQNSIGWNSQYEKLGSSAEGRLLFHLKESPQELKKAAVELLRKIGTKKSLKALAAAGKKNDPEFNIGIKRAIDSIKKR